MRVNGALGDEQLLHACTLAYLSDDLPTDAIVRARSAEEVPLATAVGLIARQRLTGEVPPRAADAGLKLVAPWIEDKAAAELDALGLTPPV